MRRSVLLVGLGAEAQTAIGLALALRHEEPEIVAADAVVPTVASAGEDLDAVIVGPGVDVPVALAQAVQAADPNLTVVLVAAPGGDEDLSRAVRFSPGLGSQTATASLDDLGSLAETVATAAERAHQRRAFRATVTASQAQLAPLRLPAASAEPLGRLLEAAPIGVITTDAGGRVRGLNRQAARLLGDDDVAGAPLREALTAASHAGLDAVLRAAGRPEPTGAPSSGVVSPATDPERMLEVFAGRFSPPAGEPGYVLLVQDVTERVRAEERRRRNEWSRRLVADVTGMLEGSLDPEELLRRLPSAVTPELADLCAIHTIEPDGSLALAALLASRPDVGERLKLVLAHIDPDAGHPTARAIRTGQAVVEPRLGARELRRIALSDEHRRLVEELGFGSAVALPLIARGRTQAVLFAVRFGVDRPFGPDEFSALREVAERAAVAVDNARLYERERRIAATLQRSLLPPALPRIAGLDAVAHYRPGARGTEVGGDWYDVLVLPDGRIGCSVGDVVGRGVEAAARMGQLRTLLRSRAHDSSDPADVLTAVDRLAVALDIADFVTAVYAVVDLAASTLTFHCAGHLPPLVIAPDGRPRLLWDGAALPLGIEPSTKRRTTTVPFERGATFVLYTDGLVERRNESINVGLDRLAAVAARAHHDAEALAADLVQELGGEADDDLALLAIRRR